jgi:catechol-2,3-dioxygenase
MPAISRLGHVGVHVKDLEGAKRFYRDILGLQVTDEDSGLGVVFMSARPAEEHHELALFGGRNVGPDARVLQQISFRCATLEDVIGFHRRLREHGVEIDVTGTHGNAITLYFFDPEGNRCEVYWGTGLPARQPYLEGVDFDRPKDEIMRRVEESVRKHGKTGFVDPTILRERKVLAHVSE